MQSSSSNQAASVQEQSFGFVFPQGTRPGQAAVRALIEAGGEEGLFATLGHVPPLEEGWLEILASGLTFDICGLTPVPGMELAAISQSYGFEPGTDEVAEWRTGEVMTLGPGGHIVSGVALAPVIRTMAGLAANLALHLPVSAVIWPPAGTAMAPAYFARLVLNWLGGGAFPALGLTSLAFAPDGSVASRGLSFFTGAEMQLEGTSQAGARADFKLALRVVDYLVGRGVPETDITVPFGSEMLTFERSQQGRRIWVWRSE